MLNWHIYLLLFLAALVELWASGHPRKGAIIALTKYWRVDRLIIRNKHIYDNLWVNGTMDILIFHQDDIDDVQQAKIRAGTPKMPITFISVEKLFRRTAKLAMRTDNPLCPRNKMSTLTPPGYKTMCAFFAYKFRDFLPRGSYDWMLRIDDDCYLKTKVKHRFPPRHASDGHVVHVMSANWIIDAGGPDSLRDERQGTDAGLLTQGLRRTVYDFAKSWNISQKNKRLFPRDKYNSYVTSLTKGQGPKGQDLYSIYDKPDNKIKWDVVEAHKDRKVWPSPATNTFYLNLTWLYSTPTVLKWMQTVEKSQCVFSNRWGDLPVWGATMALTNETRYRWDVNVEHTSHHCMYTSRHSPVHGGVRKCNDVHLPDIIDYY